MVTFSRAGRKLTRDRTSFDSVYLITMCCTVLSKSRHSQAQVPYKPSRITDATGSKGIPTPAPRRF